MAIWKIVRKDGWGDGKVHVVYFANSNMVFDCGSCHSFCPDEVLFDWIREHGGWVPGDLVWFSSGRVIHYQHRGAA